MPPLRLLVVGVGGQGVLTVARMLGDAALAAGLDVVVGQLHGMAQRGGSVEAPVLIGASVRAAFVEQADLVLGFEPLETLRALPRMTGETRVVLNTRRLVPFPLAMQGLPYPDLDRILAQLRAVAAHVLTVDGPALLARIGDGGGLNMLLLGIVAGIGVLPFEPAALLKSIERRGSPHAQERNRRAFELGLEAARGG